MDQTPQYKVVITKVQDSVFLGQGGTDRRRTVTYTVDNHGPFTLEYSQQQYTAAVVQADIAKNVAELRKLNSFQY